jgi:hypothetical protein
MVSSYAPSSPSSAGGADSDLFVTDVVVDVVGGVDGLARDRIATFAVKPQLTCEHVRELLDPGCWGALTGGRLTMRRVTGAQEPAGVSQPAAGGDDDRPCGSLVEDDQTVPYQETCTIADDLCLTPRLLFRRRSLPSAAAATSTTGLKARALEYRLAEKQSKGELVRVDQGSIVLRETVEGLRITTTKRLRFAPPLDGPGLSISLENLGYVRAFDDMVAAAVALGRKRAGADPGPDLELSAP